MVVVLSCWTMSCCGCRYWNCLYFWRVLEVVLLVVLPWVVELVVLEVVEVDLVVVVLAVDVDDLVVVRLLEDDVV